MTTRLRRLTCVLLAVAGGEVNAEPVQRQSPSAAQAPVNPFRPAGTSDGSKADNPFRAASPAATAADSLVVYHDPTGSAFRAGQAQACPAIADEKSLWELGIEIGPAAGEFPEDHATRCWEHINRTAGPLAAVRLWSPFVFQWEATAFWHRPLYFEQVNLERYGYGCHPCLQPGVSAAHFFATVPALPYCMTVERPHEHIYTLGHYRPGSCPPRRHHWPPFDPLAAAVQAGVLTGMIFLIP